MVLIEWQILFWFTIFLIFYSYAGYPILLKLLFLLQKKNAVENQTEQLFQSVSMIIPVHNESGVIANKIENIKALDFPQDNFEVIFVSDGSTDNTVELIEAEAIDYFRVYKAPERKGKANALNIGLAKAENDIIVFTDASILLEEQSLKNITKNFSDPKIGCVSGEDHIKGSDGEGLYGKYELMLRRLEANLFSIVGASGSFYAQRKILCDNFIEGFAPDFLSVLNCVKKGYRAITDPNAVGYMTNVKDQKDEFERKIRTLLRGMTTFFAYKSLLNPFNYFLFSFELISHKLFRWLVPVFLLFALIFNLLLLELLVYKIIFVMQVVFYVLALFSNFRIFSLNEKTIGKVPQYFLNTNVAIWIAWIKYFSGIRQEIWEPSKR